MTDYDHFHKKAARDADARIVARGGRSIYGTRPLYATTARLGSRYPRHHELGVSDYSAPVKGSERPTDDR